jgi:hypothetical protein
VDNHCTLPILAGLKKHWASCPPVHVSVAAYLGYGKRDKSQEIQNAEFENFLASCPKFDPGLVKND